MSIEPRLRERRREVAEQNAQREVGRLLRFLAVILSLGAVIWLLFSPWLSVSQVQVSGVVTSDANSILVDNQVLAGTPMFRINAGRVEDSLLEDPWIASARVDLVWPDEVVVEVVERTPVAWTNTSSGWTRRALDGVALPSGSKPDASMARIVLPDLEESAVTTSPELLGALDFFDALPIELHAGAKVTIRDSELWATVAGFQVRLGRSIEMREKATSLAALLEKDIPKSSVLVLIAPTNPAVRTPKVAKSDE